MPPVTCDATGCQGWKRRSNGVNFQMTVVHKRTQEDEPQRGRQLCHVLSLRLSARTVWRAGSHTSDKRKKHAHTTINSSPCRHSDASHPL